MANKKIELRLSQKEYQPYIQSLIIEINKQPEFPNFESSTGLWIMSDYGGEHKGAKFNTYSFLICCSDKVPVFSEKCKSIRNEHSLNSPFKEFSYKDLDSIRVKSSIDDFLKVSNSFIHGVLVTIAIDREIPSVFGDTKKEGQNFIRSQLIEGGLGEWKGAVAEKLMRVCHPISLYLALLRTNSTNKIMWQSDNDAINADGYKRSFSNTRSIFNSVLNLYTQKPFEINGFAKSFDKEPITSDLMSLTDFAAGAMQDLLQYQIKSQEKMISEEQAKVINWLGTKSGFLQKHNYVFTKSKTNCWDIGTVDFFAK